ncbi:hypothetical protein [Bradyrhizobium sp. URHD0069]|uniref:hypothetical protein n=1 Tax=Bradyrhizobium sp. URHD0069 TaxID=1380355 RepID=UPI00056CA1BA|nr:hypothetical protein [Bradyrhizobium sp. URHD0069]
MSQSAAPNPQADAGQLEEATDQAIAACGGDVRDAVKALIVANGYLEAEVRELRAAVSSGYARGKFEPAPRDRKD